jgi:hypothetical protein
MIPIEAVTDQVQVRKLDRKVKKITDKQKKEIYYLVLSDIRNSELGDVQNIIDNVFKLDNILTKTIIEFNRLTYDAIIESCFDVPEKLPIKPNYMFLISIKKDIKNVDTMMNEKNHIVISLKQDETKYISKLSLKQIIYKDWKYDWDRNGRRLKVICKFKDNHICSYNGLGNQCHSCMVAAMYDD